MSRNPRNSLGGNGNQGDHQYNNSTSRKGPLPSSLQPSGDMVSRPASS